MQNWTPSALIDWTHGSIVRACTLPDAQVRLPRKLPIALRHWRRRRLAKPRASGWCHCICGRWLLAEAGRDARFEPSAGAASRAGSMPQLATIEGETLMRITRRSWLQRGRSAACRSADWARQGARRRHDQDRHPAFALGHDGDQRNDPQGPDADAGRRAQRQRRPARQEDRAGRRRSRLELAAVRREGARADQQGQVAAVFGCWTSVSRKSVLPVFEELNGLLFYPLEYEGEESSYNVFYGSSVPDNKAIPAVEYLMSADGGGVKRFVLEGTDYVYPRTSNKIIRAYLKSEGRRRRGHPRELHAVRLLRLADRGRRDQGVRLGGQEDGGGLDDQRRRQRAVLQGARQSGRQGDRHPGDRVLGRRGRARRHRHQAAGRPSGGVELFRKRRHAGEQGLHRRSGAPTPRIPSASPTTRWNRPTSCSTCGRRRSSRRAPPTSTRCARR